MPRSDLVVVGSGVIGLSAAWQFAKTGAEVLLLDPHPGRGASYAAAGMLAPITEATYGEEDLVELSLRSAAAWPDFAAELEAATGLGVGLSPLGTLLVGCDSSDRAYLERLLDFHARLGLESRWCRPAECRELEPLLAPAITGGLYAAGDLQVDNRRLLGALAVAAHDAGVVMVRTAASRLIDQEGVVSGVTSTEGEEFRAPRVLVASGYSSALLAPELSGRVRAVKGQILRLRTPPEGPPLTRAVRAVVAGNSVYVVPRADGRVIVGATVEERGDHATVTVGGAYELLRDATRVLPVLREYELLEAFAAARPGSPDNAPIIGATTRPGLYVATGHFRHGILLTPVTLELLQVLFEDRPPPPWASVVSPERFTAVAGAGR